MSFEINDMYRSLRGRLFMTDPASLGLTADGDECFWGLIVDIGMEDGIVTLVVLRDGTISVYLSSGGGSIGLGQYDEMHGKADAVLTLAELFDLEGPDADKEAYPSDGSTTFTFLGFKGVRAVEVEDADLEDAQHPLHALFNAVHDLIAAAEAIDKRRSVQS